MTRRRLFDRKGRKPNQIDTIQEVLVIYVVLIVVCTAVTARAEHWNPGDAAWWAVVTAPTVGYGDFAPKTLIGRVFAGILIVGAMVLNIILGALLAAKLIVDSDAWTHTEQENMKADIAAIKAVVIPEEA